jgi:putative ATPase
MDLFSAALANSIDRPLAEKLRPKTLDEMVGQPRLLSGSTQWRRQLESSLAGGRMPSFILFGPPGCGKTTLARIISSGPDTITENCPAVETGAKILKEVCDRARLRRLSERKRTVVFVDEIHRLNRAQQDVLLASIESGDVSLLGATTENPSHTLNPALISRSQVLAFEPLLEADLETLTMRGFRALSVVVEKWLTDDGKQTLFAIADGDGRKLLNSIEWLVQSEPSGAPDSPLSGSQVQERVGALTLKFDRAGDAHYDTISAFIKSIRGSEPDAAIYYLARLATAQEDVAFIARRLMILASEDIGNADPRALQIATSCHDAVTRIGWPEAGIVFAQTVTYLACAPKSNASYSAFNAAMALVEKTGSLPIPLQLRSSKTTMSKALGYGSGYRYSHDGERGFVSQKFLPESLGEVRFLELTNRGFEKTMQQYQDWIRGQRVSPTDVAAIPSKEPAQN